MNYFVDYHIFPMVRDFWDTLYMNTMKSITMQ